MSTDNGGNSDTGGSNHPLRGQKATSFEGGVRGVGWVGGGFASIRRGVISKEMIHVSDWYVRAPTRAELTTRSFLFILFFFGKSESENQNTLCIETLICILDFILTFMLRGAYSRST